MKKLLAIAAVAVGLSVASIPANAQSYVVNGHSASKAEVQLLVSHGAQPGKWLVYGYGISAADGGPQMQQPIAGAATNCWQRRSQVLVCPRRAAVRLGLGALPHRLVGIVRRDRMTRKAASSAVCARLGAVADVSSASAA